MFANFINLSLLAVLPITALASHGPLLNRHHELAKRVEGNVDLFKRVSGSRWSFYNVETGNAGSCGKFHVNSDFTVAMNDEQMNSGFCFKNIRMTYNGKTTIASVTDTCPGCPWGGLDLTEGLFQFFAPASVGIIYGDWEFTDATDDSPATTTTPKPKPTTTTPVWVAPTTTKKKTTTTTPPPAPTTTTITTSSKPPSSSAKPSSKSTKASTSSVPPTSSAIPSSSASSINYASGVASGLAVPTATITVPSGQADNLADLNQVFIQLGGVVTAGSKV